MQLDEKRGARRRELTMPPIKAGLYLVDHLFTIGPSLGGEPVTFQEIEAWSRMTGTRLNTWEVSTLHGLSLAYVDELNAASDPVRPAPYSPADKPSRAEVSKRLEAAFDLFERQDKAAARQK